MPKQIGGAVIGSLLGQGLVNIFVGYCEEDCFDEPANSFFISASLMTSLPSSTRNPPVTVFFRH